MHFNAYTNSEISWAQQALKMLGFNPGAIDGVVGPNTKAATLAYQRSRGLAADGIIGPNTMARLKADYYGRGTLPAAPASVPATPATIPTVLPEVLQTGYTLPVAPSTASLPLMPGAPRKLLFGMDLNQLMLYGGLGAVVFGVVLLQGGGKGGGKRRGSSRRRRR